MPSIRTNAAALGLFAGLLYAVGLLGIALSLGYAVGPAEYTAVGLTWRYGGLILLAAVPVWLALRYRLAAPLVALVLVTGYVVGLELTPPGPTFQDLATVERLAEPPGITVVSDGLYIVRYMVTAGAWLVGFLGLALVESVARTGCARLPAVTPAVPWLPVSASRGQAARAAVVAGLLHAAVTTWLAIRLGVSISGTADSWLFLFGAGGMWLLAALPVYLLVRHQILTPAALLSGLLLLTLRAELVVTVDGPYPLYFGGWFVFLGVLLVAGGLEFLLRRASVGDAVPSVRS